MEDLHEDSNALLWWAVLAREASGEAAYVSALEEIAAVANAWRPQLYLAREALKRGDRASALRLYDHVLARAADGPNVLMTMTGDLGNAGALDDLVRLAAPLYRPEQHGPEPGFNLIRAYKALGRIDDGRALVRRLQAMQWKPFATMLATLESELASAQLPQPEAKPPQIVLVPFHDPLWTRGLFEPTWLLRSHDDDEPTIAFFPLANETTNAGGAQVQKADDAGRLTRGIPLFLAETLRLQFRVRTPMTALVANGHGPVVFGERMSPAEVARWVEASAGRRIAVTGAWTAHGVDLDVGDLGNDDPPTRLHVEGSLADVNALLLAARSALLTELDARGVLVPARAPSLWALPPERLVGAYVSALEQLFTQLLASNGLVDAKTLWNERGFFESYFGLVEAWPSAPESARLIAACGVVTATKYGSDVVGPYRTMLLGWIDHAPEGSALAKMAPGILKVLGESERLAKWMQNASMMQEASYAEWLARVAASP